MSLAMGTVEDMQVVYAIELRRLTVNHPELDSYEFERTYAKYRRRGYAQNEAFDYAVTCDRNQRQQRQRRASHDTGYEDPRAWL